MPRKVFFSFHYQPDIFRVNVVRQSALTHDLDDRDSFFDASLWERARSTNEDSLKQLIRIGMEGSSVVCILVGTQTWSRPWVRYEIARSVIDGKALVAVHISGIACARTKFSSPRGYNPLNHMGIAMGGDGRHYLCELVGSSWGWYSGYTLPVKPPAYLPAIEPGKVQSLNVGTREYDYMGMNGYLNLSDWIEDAAIAIGRRRTLLG